MTLLAKNPADRPRNARVVIQAIREVERTPHVIDDALRGSAEHETPHVNTSFVDRIRETEKRVRRLTLQRGRTHGDVVAARAELAELTGRSGDARGAAELYDRLGRDWEFVMRGLLRVLTCPLSAEARRQKCQSL